MRSGRSPLKHVLWACAALAVTLLVWFVFAVTQLPGLGPAADSGKGDRDTEVISCTEALRFAGAPPAPGMRDEDCTYHHFQDTHVEGTFRMPREKVADWLDAGYPAGGPEPFGCEADVCRTEELASGEADSSTVEVHHEGPGTALVHIEAFTM